MALARGIRDPLGTCSSLFSRTRIKIGFNISCKMFPWEIVCMKYHSLFSGKNKKKNINLSYAEFAMRVEKGSGLIVLIAAMFIFQTFTSGKQHYRTHIHYTYKLLNNESTLSGCPTTASSTGSDHSSNSIQLFCFLGRVSFGLNGIQFLYARMLRGLVSLFVCKLFHFWLTPPTVYIRSS